MHRFAFLFAFALVFAACDSADPISDPTPLPVQTATDVEADPVTSTGDGPPASTGRYTLYDLDENRIVLSSSEEDPDVRAQDSTSTAWDIGFSGTTIVLNGGTSGPGETVAQILTEAFADVTEAPAGGYVADGENECPAVETPGGTFPGRPLAVCTGSGNGWYSYSSDTNIIVPIPGRTIVLRTTGGDYAKLRILSYYRGNPVEPGTTESRYYTFEYVLQADGSRDFTATEN